MTGGLAYELFDLDFDLLRFGFLALWQGDRQQAVIELRKDPSSPAIRR